MQGQRIGLMLRSEEAYPTLSTRIAHQVQECGRYTHSTFIGVVNGHGNARGKVEGASVALQLHMPNGSGAIPSRYATRTLR